MVLQATSWEVLAPSPAPPRPDPGAAPPLLALPGAADPRGGEPGAAPRWGQGQGGGGGVGGRGVAAGGAEGGGGEARDGADGEAAKAIGRRDALRAWFRRKLERFERHSAVRQVGFPPRSRQPRVLDTRVRKPL